MEPLRCVIPGCKVKPTFRLTSVAAACWEHVDSVKVEAPVAGPPPADGIDGREVGEDEHGSWVIETSWSESGVGPSGESYSLADLLLRNGIKLGDL